MKLLENGALTTLPAVFNQIAPTTLLPFASDDVWWIGDSTYPLRDDGSSWVGYFAPEGVPSTASLLVSSDGVVGV